MPAVKETQRLLGVVGSVRYGRHVLISVGKKLALSCVLPPIGRTVGTPAQSVAFWSSWYEKGLGLPTSTKYATAASKLQVVSWPLGRRCGFNLLY